MTRWLFPMLCLIALTACGQKGPLYKPGNGPENTPYLIGTDRPSTDGEEPRTNE